MEKQLIVVTPRPRGTLDWRRQRGPRLPQVTMAMRARMPTHDRRRQYHLRRRLRVMLVVLEEWVVSSDHSDAPIAARLQRLSGGETRMATTSAMLVVSLGILALGRKAEGFGAVRAQTRIRWELHFHHLTIS